MAEKVNLSSQNSFQNPVKSTSNNVDFFTEINYQNH